MIQIHFLDVGQGDSTFILFPNGTTMLIDCNIKGDNSLLHWLDKHLPSMSNGKRVLDYLVITHPHKDHFSGIGKLAKRYRINNMWESGHRLYVPRTENEEYQDYDDYLRLIQTVKRQGGEHKALEAFSKICISHEPDVEFLILSPARAYLKKEKPTKRDIHDQCTVMKMNYVGGSVLFTGDSSMEAWKELIVPYYSDLSGKPNLLKSTIIHASHHGSYTFFKPEGKKEVEPFTLALTKIQPQITIISVGENNKHGHPDDEALSLYEHYTDDQVYLTKKHGNIKLELHRNGEHQIEVENEGFSIREMLSVVLLFGALYFFTRRSGE